ncbi:hypothetical protein C2845_PM17G12710 [Panicum miliaceum]|uniref:KIB1-4 beta-propeller domain-containing protein n=1 Tax=Panicum miliaceum TaxID=4540 RepID=A0A3L6Q104_PANMI|nr:hypothetical protein C2845_PM17G12710 [Panicum miliaceum]
MLGMSKCICWLSSCSGCGAGELVIQLILYKVADPSVELNTTELQLYKVDTHGQRLVKLDGLRDYALFLGYNASMCLRVEEFPGLEPNSAYVMDDSTEFMNFYKYNKREIGVWDIQRQSLQSLSDASPLPLKETEVSERRYEVLDDVLQ